MVFYLDTFTTISHIFILLTYLAWALLKTRPLSNNDEYTDQCFLMKDLIRAIKYTLCTFFITIFLAEPMRVSLSRRLKDS